MSTRPRRLVVWGGAAVVIVVGAPIAYASDAGARSVVSVSGGHPASQNTDNRGNVPEPLPGNAFALDCAGGS